MEFFNGNTIDNLRQYLTRVAEWKQLELKESSRLLTFNADGKSIKHAVCGLSNADGGQVFLGVSDKHEIIGVDFNNQKLSQILSQGNSRRELWYETDLTHVVKNILPVTVESNKIVYVITVTRTGIPVFCDDDGKLMMYLRDGSETISLGGPQALIWYRERKREEIIQLIFREFKMIANQPLENLISSMSLPYLDNCMREGYFYTFLSEEDRNKIFGMAITDSSNRKGFLSEFFELRNTITRERENVESKYENSMLFAKRIRGAFHMNVETALQSSVKDFREFLTTQKICE